MRTVVAHNIAVGDRIAAPISYVTVTAIDARPDLGYVRITHEPSEVVRAMQPGTPLVVVDDVPTMTDLLVCETDQDL